MAAAVVAYRRLRGRPWRGLISALIGVIGYAIADNNRGGDCHGGRYYSNHGRGHYGGHGRDCRY